MKYLLSIAAVAVIGLVLFQFDWIGSDSTESVIESTALFTARVDTLSITVTEEGYLKAKKSVNLQPQFNRQGVISWIVEEGASVKEGDVLIEFEKTEITAEIDDLMNSLIQYETELEAARADLAIQERENEATIEDAELALEIARMNLERYEKGEAPNELRIKKLSVEEAETELKRADEQYLQVPQLHEEGFLTKIQVEEERIKVRRAQITLENAQKDLELFESYTYVMELTQKNADVKDRGRNLINAKEKAGINLKERQARTKQHERRVTSANVRLEKLKKELVAMTMKAPQAGIVHYGDPDNPWHREEVKVGNHVYRGMTLMTLPDLSEMQVLVQVHEADIDLVEKEMDVIITVESAKGQSFQGKVTKIASVASSSWSDRNNKTFQIEITMDSNEAQLRAGISAKAEILVEELPEVLIVPIHAVIAEGGKYFCFVQQTEPRSVLKRIVQVGKNNAHFVEIQEGLELGAQVLLYDPRESGQFEDSGGTRDDDKPPSGTEGDDDEKNEPPALPSPALAGIDGGGD